MLLDRYIYLLLITSFKITLIKKDQLMFNPKLSQSQQEMFQILMNSQQKGLAFFQMYASPDRNQALNLLKLLQPQTIRLIKEDLQAKCAQAREMEQCKSFCTNFYYCARNHSIKSSKRNWALFGIFAFTLIDCLCAWGVYKTATYYFADSGEPQKPFDSSFWNILGKIGKFIGIFILGSYSAAGLWHGTGFLLMCLSNYFYRKKQSKQLMEQMEHEILTHTI